MSTIQEVPSVFPPEAIKAIQDSTLKLLPDGYWVVGMVIAIVTVAPGSTDPNTVVFPMMNTNATLVSANNPVEALLDTVIDAVAARLEIEKQQPSLGHAQGVKS